MTSLPRDNNRIPVIGATSSTDGTTPVAVYADPTTHRLLVDIANIGSHIGIDQFTSTNNQTVFTASATPLTNILMVVSGQVQSPTFDYNVVGSTYTLTSGIPAGLQVLLIYTK